MTSQPTAGNDVTARPAITDGQVIEWAAGAADAMFPTIRTLNEAHQFFDAAKIVISQRLGEAQARHLLQAIELWPNLGTDGTPAGMLITVDLPAGTPLPVPDGTRLTARSGKRRDGAPLTTLQLDLDELVDPARPYLSPEKLAADLIGSVLHHAREAIAAHRRALHADDLATAINKARAALGGDSAAERGALHNLIAVAATVLESGQL